MLSARYSGADPLRQTVCQNAETELNPFRDPQPMKVAEKRGDAFGAPG